MIGFLNPLALLGLAAASIPAILHLIHRRVPPVVEFPAIRYIADAERVHSRRIKLRNLLLLILRTLLILLVVLAAARPVVRGGFGGSHPPTAVALVFDNSISSAAVEEGGPTIDRLREQARVVLDEVKPEDRLWVVMADGIVRRMGVVDARAVIDSATPTNLRLDLGEAVRGADAALGASAMASREIVVISDLQASALSGGGGVESRVVVLEPGEPPLNRGIDSVVVTPAVWSPTGQVAVAVGGDESEPAAVTLSLGGEPLARSVARVGESVILEASLGRPGWFTAEIDLDADEFHPDDHLLIPLVEAEPARVSSDGRGGVFLAQAIGILRENGRIRSGDEVSFGSMPAGEIPIIFPPSDPALIGALNRALEQAGVDWRFGEIRSGEWQLAGMELLSDVTVGRMAELSGGTEPAIATAGGRPWLVRSGGMVILASRLEPGWTDLPLRAAFVPFVDELANRLAARTAWTLRVAPGDPLRTPPVATSILVDGDAGPIEPGHDAAAPLVPGVYFLTGQAGDTVGAVTVALDRRESRLRVAERPELRAVFGPDVVVASGSSLSGSLFRTEGRADLTSALLIAAVLAAFAELLVATSTARRTEPN